MAKKKTPNKKKAGEVAKKVSEAQVQPEPMDPFIGGEEDDLADMTYPQDETTVGVDTVPPATAEEAAERAEQVPEPEVKEEPKDDKTPEQTETEAKAEEPEPTEKADAVVLDASDSSDSVDEDGSGPEGPVPFNRFEEVNQRMKAAEATNKDLKKQLDTVIEEKSEPEPEPYDYEAKEKEAMDAVLEGDSKKHTAIRAEIRAAEKADILREAGKAAVEGDKELRQVLTFEEAGAKIEVQYPALSEPNENFNEAAREEFLDLYVGFAKSGRYTSVAALQRAAEVVAKIHNLNPLPAEEPETPDNVVNIKPPDVEKKTKLADSQPPELESRAPGTGNVEPKIDVLTMPDDEFEALPDATKRRLRGDIL